MNSIIYGNDLLVSIAWNASSPSQAAKKAQAFGCSKEQVRAVRNAAALKRDSGEDAFCKEFLPFDIVDTDLMLFDELRLKVCLDRTFLKRPLNPTEVNQVLDVIEAALVKLGVSLQAEKIPTKPWIRSNLRK